MFVAGTPMTARMQSAPRTKVLLAHAGVLTALLMLLMPLIGVDKGPFISDEGGVLLQLDTLAERGGWWAEYPLRDLDPDGRWVPINYAAYDDGRVMPFPSRPAYPLLLLLPYRLAGIWGVTAVGLAGVGLAALFAGLIARELDSRAALPALWLTGIGTPLVFHGYVLQAHSLGAAVAGVAGWVVVRQVQRRPLVAGHLLLALCLAVGILVRREVAFLAIAMAVALTAAWMSDREHQRGGLTAACLALVGCASGLLLASRLARWFGGLDRALASPVAGDEQGGLIDRVTTAAGTLLRTTYDTPNLGDAVWLAALTIMLVGTLLWLRRSDRVLMLLGLATIGGAVAIRVAVPTEIAGIVPGLLVACPILICGTLAAGRNAITDPGPRVLLTTAGLFTAAVLATQYSNAGAWEWGARYLAASLPLITPVAALGLLRLLDSRPASLRPWVVAAIALATVAPSALALGAQHDVRQRGAHVVDTLVAVAGPDGTIVTTAFALGRFDLHQPDDEVDRRWGKILMGRLDEFADVAERAGVTRWVLVGWGPYDATIRLDGSSWGVDGPFELPALWTTLRYWIVTR
jgi:hypothetical protein